MKKVDSEEFYQSEQFNTFSEYQPFSAENYSMPEAAKPPKESNTYDESFENQGVQSTKEEKESGKDNAKELQKQYDKLNNSNSQDTGDTSSTPSSPTGADGAQTAANGSQAASTASSGAASSAGVTAGAATGATAVAAVIIISGGITGGFISDFNSHIKSDVGMDYVSITVDMDELISQADSSYNLSAENFSIELKEGGATSNIVLLDGKHSYLLTGLQPNKTYTYNLICNNPSLGSTSNCYSNSFTTLSLSEPRGVYDELNNFITYDELTQTATVGYSVYISDCDGAYDGYSFYVCSSEQTDPSSVNSVIYSSQTLDGDNFFRGEVEGITCNELYLYVVGERVGEYGAEAAELFSLQLVLDIPEEWQTDNNNPAFEVDESAEDITCRPDSIYISGALTNFNQNYTYYAYIMQYDKDGTALAERQEVGLVTDAENMTYSVNGEAYYGVNTYKYVICTLDENGSEVVVYESGSKTYTADQSYSATYTKVEPTDATIEYTAEKITITVDPEFTCAYNNYSYKLVVTNSAGGVFGEYQGDGVATIEITDFADLDEINFTYYDLGEFAGSEVELATHTTTGMAFNHIFMAVDESAEEIAEQPDCITVNGKLTKINENFTYSAYINQYNADGTALIEKEEVSLNIDPSTMSYTIESEAYYGVNTYEYVIYTVDENSNEIVVYSSGSKTYMADQSYSATYTKVEPTDATIEYTAEKITITVDPEFTCAYNNYSYKLVVTNSAGEVFGEYQGDGVATIEITDFADLDEINFTYYDLGEFAGSEVELATHTTTGMAFNHIFMAVDESAEEIAEQPDCITVNGKLTKINENFTYSAYINQYNADGVALTEREEVSLNIDPSTMSYTIESAAYYGVNTYEYVICTVDENSNEIVVYSSGSKVYTADQSYSATYNKVEPADATIEYTAEKITITVDPEFTCAYNNYSYKLVVTNSAGEVFGEYQGDGVATIEITDFADLDEINFTYYDLGEFAGSEQTLGSHTTTGVTVFKVSQVKADVSNSNYDDKMSVDLSFDYTLPDDYQVKVTDEANAIDLTLALAEVSSGYKIEGLDLNTEYNLTIQVLDADGNALGEAKTVNISKSAAEAEYTSPTMNCPNPGDAVVTYNDDGTINIYREMIPDVFGRDTISDDERIYYNANIQGYYLDGNYNVVNTSSIDVIGRGKYAVIENIPKTNYIFNYYTMFDYNGVSYVMSTTTTSGSFEVSYECGSAISTVADGQTTITLSISKYGSLEDKIIVNGTEYTYTTYADEYETNPTLVIDGEVEVNEVTIFFSVQGGNYDSYSDLTMKGSKYGEYTITVEAVEA